LQEKDLRSLYKKKDGERWGCWLKRAAGGNVSKDPPQLNLSLGALKQCTWLGVAAFSFIFRGLKLYSGEGDAKGKKKGVWGGKEVATLRCGGGEGGSKVRAGCWGFVGGVGKRKEPAVEREK